jgi:two-component system chemotaxis response regulator CheY
MSVVINSNLLANVHILVVDDDTLMQKLIRDVLVALGFIKIFTVSNGNKALEIIAHEDIDLVICDWRMPGMSGVELVKKIRNLPVLKKSFISIIMLTGNAEMSDIKEARDTGITEYLIKPFRVKDLCARIIEIIEHPREFVISEQYKGPSRRRKQGKAPDGLERRKNRPPKK